MKFGSTIYGTSTPESDTDYKAIYLPSGNDIVMQRIQGSINNNTKKDERSKNTADDIDIEMFSLDKYIKLLLEGQTVAIDMLFTPDEFIEQSSPLWDHIRENKDKFLHSGILSFVGYCRTQANKYGIKGSRMRAVKDTIEFFKAMTYNHPNSFDERLRDAFHISTLEAFAEGKEFINVIMLTNKDGLSEPYLEVVGRKYGMGITVKEVFKLLTKIWDNYGERSRQAMNNDGIDWKALMHAVRIQHEAQELLTTGHITFPRPERELLLKIRNNKHKVTMPYKEVAKIIEDGLDDLEALKSNLPKKPNYVFASKLVENAYSSEVIKYYG